MQMFLRVRHAIIPLTRTSTSTSSHFRSGELANHWLFAIFVKWDFDLKFISLVHVKVANVASVFNLVSQKFCIQELYALQKQAIIQFVEKQRDVFINLAAYWILKILNISSVAVGF